MITRLYLSAVLATSLISASPASATPAAWPEITEEALAPKMAPAGHDVTIVVFSDYLCPYCLRLHAVLQQAMQRDHKVRIVYRDWPIFGEASARAARLAIASQFQHKYEAFNNALFALSGHLDDASLRMAARQAGVNWGQLQRDLALHDRQIARLMGRSDAAAKTLGFEGTPGLLVGTTRAFGAPDLAELEELIRQARNQPNSKPAA
jgi:protein-disulfide isomerase